MRRGLATVVLVLLAVTLHAEGPAADADALYRAQKWSEALPLYQKMAADDPQNGQAWYRAAVSLHHLGRLDDAIAAYMHAVELKFAPQSTAYNLAAAYALKKDPANAYAWLDKAVGFGFRDENGLASDPDFASIREEPRFKAVQATVAKAAHPCRAPEYRALDFWVGEWIVRDSRGGYQVGTSSVQRILDDCVVLEKWTGGMGGTGESFNTIDPATGKWRQTWADSSAQIYDFTGDAAADRMIYQRSAKSPAGKPMLLRMTLSKLPTGEVRQLSEQSLDDGKTWSVGYDFMYRAK